MSVTRRPALVKPSVQQWKRIMQQLLKIGNLRESDTLALRILSGTVYTTIDCSYSGLLMK